MLLKNILFYQLCAFYILGQISINPLLNSRNAYPRYLQYIPTLVALIINCATSIIAIGYQLFYAITHDWTDAIVGSILFVIEMICIFSAIIQSLCYSEKLLKVKEAFEFIEEFLYQRFQIKMKFRTFIKRYLVKTLVSLCFYSTTILAKLCLPTIEPGLLVEASYSILRILIIISKLHALFYISLLKSFNKFSIDILKMKLNGSNLHVRDIVNIFKNFKIIHFKLYGMAMELNDLLGWILVTVLVQTFFDATYTLYWVFYYLQRGDQLNFISKFMCYVQRFHCLNICSC